MAVTLRSVQTLQLALRPRQHLYQEAGEHPPQMLPRLLWFYPMVIFTPSKLVSSLVA